MKKIRVREAKSRDLGLFRKLHKEFFEDPENKGLLVEYDDSTKEYFDALFHVYVESGVGIVLFVADKGMIMAGPIETNASFKLGKVASVWAAHVSEDSKNQGIETALYSEALYKLRQLGFNGVVSASPAVGTWVDVVEKAGAEPFMIQHVIELEVEDELD